ncbi:MAG: uracil-DNA glycosylase [Lachnospiraceae bacterium]|nr:uracil-DNA glycosylase [Lachnospiraceae bacterium]
MHPSWKEKLFPIRDLALSANKKAVEDQFAGNEIYPNVHDRFNAFNMSFDSVKVVIIGQDPYHGPGQANGLAFSVNKGMKIPPSLLNIYKELETDMQGFKRPDHGDLTDWVNQGVLLLNTSLSVMKGQPASHKNYGWEEFTTGVINILDKEHDSLVFIAWGSHAQKVVAGLSVIKHCIIKSVHPSPLSADRGFFGSKPFSRCNNYLIQIGKKPIDWTIK